MTEQKTQNDKDWDETLASEDSIQFLEDMAAKALADFENGDVEVLNEEKN